MIEALTQCPSCDNWAYHLIINPVDVYTGRHYMSPVPPKVEVRRWCESESPSYETTEVKFVDKEEVLKKYVRECQLCDTQFTELHDRILK